MMKKLCCILLTIVLVAAMSVSAFAAWFTPSVENKPAPEIVVQIGPDGKEYAAIIYDKNGRFVIGVPNGDLIVTPISSNDAPTPEIRAKLEAAYEQIQSAEKLTDLYPDLEKLVKEKFPNLSLDDVVVRDLFDATVTGIFEDYLSQEGNSISVRFRLPIDPQSLVAVLYCVDGTNWVAVPYDRITRNKDFTVDILFDDLCPVAFLFENGTLHVDPNAPKSPQTGAPLSDSLVWVGVAAVVIFAFTYGAVKKRTSQRV